MVRFRADGAPRRGRTTTNAATPRRAKDTQVIRDVETLVAGQLVRDGVETEQAEGGDEHDDLTDLHGRRQRPALRFLRGAGR